MKTIHGLDTETPLGMMQIIATEEEAKEVSTFTDVLAFLSQRKHRGNIFFTFNLRFDAESMLKLTGNMEFLTKLYFEGAAPKGIPVPSALSSHVRIRYIPSKFLRICWKYGSTGKSSRCVSIYDIAQFYSGWSLEMVARKYLGDYKNPISGKKLGSEPGYYEANKEAVLEYCRKDAELTLRAAELMSKTVTSVKMPKGKLSFRNPISQAKISEMYIRDNFKYPKIPDGVEFHHWLSEQAYHGGIFSTQKRGMFNQKLYSYDINSAYPFQMDKLPHWANGQFVVVEKPDEIDTRYGWFLAQFDCPFISYPDFSHPYEVEFCFNEIDPLHCETVLVNPKRIVYPIGTRRQWVTKIEYEWMLKYGYPVEFRGGVAWQQEKEEYESPFSWVKDVYYARKEIKTADKEDIRQWALKIAMNGAYGKTAQKRKGIGALTNFFYASYITAGTRMQIASVMKQKPDAIVEIATDSILSLEPLSVNVSDKLGEWSFNEYEKCLVIGSGIRQQWKADNAFVTHARGLTYKSDWNMLKEIESGFNEKEKRANIDCDYLYFEKERPLHLGEVIFHHRLLSLKDLGVFTRVSKRLQVNTDKKRRWERDYLSFRDMLVSEPQDSEPLRMGIEL